MVYLPPHFVETDRDAIFALIESNPLGMLITMGSQGITANPIPSVLDRDWGEQGRLLLHVARNNPVWRDFDPEVEALVVFQAGDRYITPNWYASKADDARGGAHLELRHGAGAGRADRA